MDTIFERLAERSHQEGRQKGHQEGWREAELIFQQERQEAEFIFQQKQEAFEREREAARQKTLTRNREIVLGIVNHSLKLDAAGQEKIVNQLEKIDDEDVLNKLINAALDASRGDFEFFMMLLEFESKQSS